MLGCQDREHTGRWPRAPSPKLTCAVRFVCKLRVVFAVHLLPVRCPRCLHHLRGGKCLNQAMSRDRGAGPGKRTWMHLKCALGNICRQEARDLHQWSSVLEFVLDTVLPHPLFYSLFVPGPLTETLNQGRALAWADLCKRDALSLARLSCRAVFLLRSIPLSTRMVRPKGKMQLGIQRVPRQATARQFPKREQTATPIGRPRQAPSRTGRMHLAVNQQGLSSAHKFL